MTRAQRLAAERAKNTARAVQMRDAARAVRPLIPTTYQEKVDMYNAIAPPGVPSIFDENGILVTGKERLSQMTPEEYTKYVNYAVNVKSNTRKAPDPMSLARMDQAAELAAFNAKRQSDLASFTAGNASVILQRGANYEPFQSSYEGVCGPANWGNAAWEACVKKEASKRLAIQAGIERDADMGDPPSFMGISSITEEVLRDADMGNPPIAFTTKTEGVQGGGIPRTMPMPAPSVQAWDPGNFPMFGGVDPRWFERQRAEDALRREGRMLEELPSQLSPVTQDILREEGLSALPASSYPSGALAPPASSYTPGSPAPTTTTGDQAWFKSPYVLAAVLGLVLLMRK